MPTFFLPSVDTPSNSSANDVEDHSSIQSSPLLSHVPLQTSFLPERSLAVLITHITSSANPLKVPLPLKLLKHVLNRSSYPKGIVMLVIYQNGGFYCISLLDDLKNENYLFQTLLNLNLISGTEDSDWNSKSQCLRTPMQPEEFYEFIDACRGLYNLNQNQNLLCVDANLGDIGGDDITSVFHHLVTAISPTYLMPLSNNPICLLRITEYVCNRHHEYVMPPTVISANDQFRASFSSNSLINWLARHFSPLSVPPQIDRIDAQGESSHTDGAECLSSRSASL